MKKGLDGSTDQQARLHTDLTLVLYRMGRYEEGAAVGKKSMEFHTEQWGAEHPDTAAALGRCALPFLGMGQFEMAEKMFGEACRLLQQSDPFHVRILDQVRNQATCLIGMGRGDEAAQNLREHGRIYSKREESPLLHGSYSLVMAKVLAKLPQKHEDALQYAVDAKTRFQNPANP